MKSRALVFGVVVAMLGVVLQLLYMRGFEKEASGGAKIDILVAAQPIERGATIGEELLGVRAVPQAYVDDRAIRAADKEDVIGLRAATKVPVLQTLVWTDLISTADERRDLSTLVQPGNRALALRIDQNEVTQLIRPGDFIDLLNVDGEGHKASVLLQRVLVLATGLDTNVEGTKDRKRSSSRMLTVSVTLREAQLLNLAQTLGRISAVVRNAGDPRTQEAPPDVSRTELFDAQVRRTVIKNAPTAPVKLMRGTN